MHVSYDERYLHVSQNKKNETSRESVEQTLDSSGSAHAYNAQYLRYGRECSFDGILCVSVCGEKEWIVRRSFVRIIGR
jgi:hypothetical protein